jgi:hypothetical protein
MEIVLFHLTVCSLVMHLHNPYFSVAGLAILRKSLLEVLDAYC